MSQENNASIPKLDAAYEAYAEEIGGWAAGSSTATDAGASYSAPP